MENFTAIIVLFSICVLSIVPLFIFGHEFSHVYFNDFRFDKVCFLDCPSSLDAGYTNFGENKVNEGSPIAGVISTIILSGILFPICQV